jgi:hypothetical protein
VVRTWLRVAGVAILCAGSACGSPNRYTVPRALPAGRAQAWGAVELAYRVHRAEYFGYPDARKADALGVDVPQLGGRLGLGHGLEAGVASQLAIGQTSASLKFEILRSRYFDAAFFTRAGFNVGPLLIPRLVSARARDYRFYGTGDAAVLLGWNVGTVTLVLSPGLLGAINIGGYPGLTGTAGVGVSVRVTRSWGFMPELTVLAPLEGRATLSGASFGIAFFGGGRHPFPRAAPITTSAE